MPERDHTPSPSPRLVVWLGLAGCAALVLAAGLAYVSAATGPEDPSAEPPCHCPRVTRFGAGSAPGWGPPFGDGPRHRHLRGCCGGPGGMRILDQLPEDLSLTEQQRVEIKQVMDEAEAAVEPLARSLEAKRDAVHEAMHAESLDEAALRAALRAHSDVESEVAVLRARTRARVATHLTQAQRDYLRDRIRNRDRDHSRQRERYRDRLRERDFRSQHRMQRGGGKSE